MAMINPPLLYPINNNNNSRINYNNNNKKNKLNKTYKHKTDKTTHNKTSNHIYSIQLIPSNPKMTSKIG